MARGLQFHDRPRHIPSHSATRRPPSQLYQPAMLITAIALATNATASVCTQYLHDVLHASRQLILHFADEAYL